MWWRHARPNPSEATESRVRAERDLARRRADTGRIRAVIEGWRRVRDHNNFAEAFRHSIQGGHR